ncbi:MAG: Holliday junction branch migration protein RuvA [Candidatus Yanofskybacteria bacterium]|nr:Holliday junction branch migration protein RuvA [Candidatus Yanofskybacteria bacterium]
MIGYIEGTVVHIGEKQAIVSAGGIGYPLTLLPKILASLSENQEGVKVFVYSKLNLREGTYDFYGFTRIDDLELFRLLTSISGLGPKTALQIMSTVEPRHLKEAVAAEDPQALRKISGLGLKTAQRLVVELQGKLDYIDATGTDLGALDMEAQALEALVSLGYSQTQAKEALKQVKDATDLGDRVRKALQMLAKK